MEISRIPGSPTGEPQSLRTIPRGARALQRLAAGLPDGERADHILLRSGLGATLAAELIRLWEGSTTQRPDAAIAYEAARRASTPEIALNHLERAVKSNPDYAIAAISDPEFSAVREPLARMIEHLTMAARQEAQAAIREAEKAIAAEAIDSDPDRSETAVILNASEARYQLNTYAGYIEAAIAARLVAQIAVERVKARSLSSNSIADRVQRALEQLGRIGIWGAHGVGLLWERFPLFAILLGWFGVGAGFGVLTWAFGAGPEFRWLLDVWSMGLVAIVMVGFLRSLRK